MRGPFVPPREGLRARRCSRPALGATLKIVVTRPEGQAEPLAGRLRRLGHEVLACPLIRIEPLGEARVDVARYDWVVVTSANGAHELARRAGGAVPRVAAIGPGTAKALREEGITPALVARVSTQEGLVAELPQPAGSVLLAAAEDARRYLVDALAADFLPLYRTVPLPVSVLPVADVVVLASASAARAWARTGSKIPVVSIGPQTSTTARDGGLEVAAEAATHDLDGLVSAIESLG